MKTALTLSAFLSIIVLFSCSETVVGQRGREALKVLMAYRVFLAKMDLYLNLKISTLPQAMTIEYD